jgi:protein-disulfide isomerase
MSNQNKGNINLPLVIIGLVLIVALGGGLWACNGSKSGTNTSPNGVKTNSTPKSGPTPLISNEMGAQPPNMLGSPNSSVTVEEFADFQCPTCGLKHPMMKELMSTYGTRVKFIFRDFPLAIPAHDKAYDAAVAAEAAGLQGRFWEMQNQLFTNQAAWTSNPDFRKVWEDYAAKIGLDVEKFKNDVAGLNAKARVDADLKRGRSLNVNSTPSIFVNGVLVQFEQMNIDAMRQIIDAELTKAPSTNQSAPNAPANTSGSNQSAPSSSSGAAPAEPKK